MDCDDELQGNMQRYRANREILLRELPGAGFKKLAPSDGAFYIYADVSSLTRDAGDFCKQMLLAAGASRACLAHLASMDLFMDAPIITIMFKALNAGAADDGADACRGGCHARDGL